MFPVTADETSAPARRCGLDVVHLTQSGDPLGRAEVTWSHLGFERP
ncbi:hypothetical protein [Streptomyces sp. I05A-00742]|nr:hypothetical protein [Streptomyces sp. I05A-00742]